MFSDMRSGESRIQRVQSNFRRLRSIYSVAIRSSVYQVLHDHVEDFQILRRILWRRLDRLALDNTRIEALPLQRVGIFVSRPDDALRIVAFCVALLDLQRDRKTLNVGL